MGDENDPQRGFDHWAAFRGQGTYYPDGHGTSRVVPQNDYSGYNINGKKVPQKGYITDELTDMSIDWLDNRKAKDKPFFIYVSHKGVHADFVPRDEDRGTYKDGKWKRPDTYFDTEETRKLKPMWLINQRNSRHGAGFGYNLDNFDLDFYYKRYCEALIPIDDAVGHTMKHLEKMGELDNTIFVYMGDNGFQFGDHGLIDKRTAYEASMRVPMIIRYPQGFKGGTVIEDVVANIDVTPTLLEAAGLEKPEQMHGDSFWKILHGKKFLGVKFFFMNTSGNGTILILQQLTLFVANVINSFVTMVSGTQMNFTTSSKIQKKNIILSTSLSTKKELRR